MTYSVTIDKEPRDVVRDDESARMVPATKGSKGPIFSVRALDYYDVQAVYGGVDTHEQCAIAFRRGLVAIDGDADKAADFVASPAAEYGGPLWRYLWDAALGNSQTG